MSMTVRPLAASDVGRWIELRGELWPEHEGLEEDAHASLAATPPLNVFVAEFSGRTVAFLELSLRSYGEGCESSPVPYVEGWYVEPAQRRKGVGAALMRAAEEWSREHAYRELASDTEVENLSSRKAHAALGFAEVETLVVFRKKLGS